MSFDHITETITHFIGTFQMTTEAMRLRDEYDAFRYRPEAQRPDIAQEHLPVQITAPYDLEGFTPGLTLELPALAAGTSDLPNWQPQAMQGGAYFNLSFTMPLPPAAFRFTMQFEADIQWKIPLPPEVITVTLQSLYLADNDLLSFRGGTTFIAPQGLMEQMHGFAAEAAQMGGDLSNLIYQLLPDAGLPSGTQVMDFAQALAALPGGEGSAPLIRLSPQDMPETEAEEAADAAAPPARIYINGNAAEEMPDPLEYLPASVAARIDPSADTEGDDTGTQIAEDLTDTDLPSAGYADDYAVPAGHHLSTGGNLTVNEAYIAANGVDADVLLIGGDRVQIDVISQVNLAYTTAGTAFAYPQGMGGPGMGGVDAGPQVSLTLRGIALDGDTDQGSGLAGVSGSPQTGDTSSPNTASDAETDALAGGTRAFNAARIDPAQTSPDPAAPSPTSLSFPAHWQVERIEGDVVFENRIDQHVFASDHDRIEAVFTAAASQISTGDNTLANFTTLQALSQHYDFIIIGGNYTSLNVIQQVNVLFDVDHIIGGGSGAAGLWGWGDNLLMNSAEILHAGLDAMQEMQDNFARELESLAGGAANLSASVAQDALFAGRDILSALYISGDLIESNIIRQFSYLGDVDQIALAEGAAMVGALAAGMSIETGGNAMLNAARINDLGINSTLMTAGDVYSDALIHQAGLIDDQMPGVDGMAGLHGTGGSYGALTSEAVAFLAPEMMEHSLPDPAQGQSNQSDYASSLLPQDGMQLLVA